jgi:hypothetical protein
MAGIDPLVDPRGALWEERLDRPVLIAALLAIPTVILYFSAVDGPLVVLTTVLAWGIWAVFLLEAVIMLTVVRDRWAWVRGHWFGLAIVIATFPLLTKILEGLLAARALSSVQGVRILQALYLAKAGKIIKSALIVRKKGRRTGHPLVMSLLWLVGAAAVVGIGHRIATGEKHSTPFHNLWDLLESAPPVALGAALVAGAVGGATLLIRRRRRILAEQRDPAAARPVGETA